MMGRTSENPNAVAADGRQSKYLQDPHGICDYVVKLGSQGYSINQITAALGIAPGTMRNWRREYPMFAEAIEIARTKSIAWWEAQAQSGYANNVIGASIWNKSMAARAPEQYTDRLKVEDTPEAERRAMIEESMSDAEAAEAYQRTLRGE